MVVTLRRQRTTTLSAKSLAESEARLRQKREHCDAASEKFSPKPRVCKANGGGLKVKAQEAAARAAQSHDAPRAAESAQEATERLKRTRKGEGGGLVLRVLNFFLDLAAAVAKSDDDSDLIDKDLDPNSYAAKLVPQIPSYKLAAALAVPR